MLHLFTLSTELSIIYSNTHTRTIRYGYIFVKIVHQMRNVFASSPTTLEQDGGGLKRGSVHQIFSSRRAPCVAGPRMQNSNRDSRCVLARVTTLWRERYRTYIAIRFRDERDCLPRLWNDRGCVCYGRRLWTEIQRRWGRSEEYYGSGTKLECKFLRLEKWWIFSFLPPASFFLCPLSRRSAEEAWLS